MTMMRRKMSLKSLHVSVLGVTPRSDTTCDLGIILLSHGYMCMKASLIPDYVNITSCHTYDEGFAQGQDCSGTRVIIQL